MGNPVPNPYFVFLFAEEQSFLFHSRHESLEEALNVARRLSQPKKYVFKLEWDALLES